jgi:hypothetical protein
VQGYVDFQMSLMVITVNVVNQLPGLWPLGKKPLAPDLFALMFFLSTGIHSPRLDIRP